MQNKILLIIIGVLSFVLIYVSSSNHTTFFITKKDTIKVKDLNNDIKKMDIEDYIVGVVAAEMPASFEEEALKAQAVAARSYAYYKMQNSKSDFDVVTDVSNQSYISIDKMKEKWQEDYLKYYTKVKKAVTDTKGLVMVYDNEIIEAFYFAMSNGYTEDSSLVFNEDLEYLHSVESSYDNASLKNFLVTKEFSQEEFCQKLNITCQKIIINDLKRSATGRVNTIVINQNEFKGTTFRSLLNLRSTDFTISLADKKVIITTKGYGHGVGMSQYGANGMAKDGHNYEDILKYYYQNVEIASI